MPTICCHTTMKIKSVYYSFLRNLGQTETGAENDGDKKISCKNSEFSGFSKRTINHQSNENLAIKPCLGDHF